MLIYVLRLVSKTFIYCKINSKYELEHLSTN